MKNFVPQRSLCLSPFISMVGLTKYKNQAIGKNSVLISIPLRYMHTTVEMLHRDDIENTIRLMYETLIALTPKTNLSYL